jgi:hypothetical protein
MGGYIFIYPSLHTHYLFFRWGVGERGLGEEWMVLLLLNGRLYHHMMGGSLGGCEFLACFSFRMVLA